MGSAVRMSARSCDCVQMFREWIRARPSVERSISRPNSERPVSSHTEQRENFMCVTGSGQQASKIRWRSFVGTCAT